MTDEYREKYEAGCEYQDFIQKELLKYGLVVMLNSSRLYQVKLGESLSGIEIKNDRRCHETGNLYIEVAEKADANNANFVASGIYRYDNTWLYGVGDYHDFYMMPKVQLKTVYERLINEPDNKYRKRGVRTVTTPTSIAMVIPIDYAKEIGLIVRHISFDEANGNDTG